MSFFFPKSKQEKPAEEPGPAQEEAEAEKEQSAPTPLTPEERQRLIADMIDAENADRYEKLVVDKVNDPARKHELDWMPDITPQDQKWKDKRKEFRQLLRATNVQEILDKNFERAQYHYIMPPTIDDTILKIQNEHTALYNAAFEKGGKFVESPNNLATKLTMLHFGLPIAPLTLNNIVLSGNEKDVDDPPDDPEELPRIQRILYAEKPLEFLDKYHQRSHGFPILRRPKPNYTPRQLSHKPSQTEADSNGHSASNAKLQPQAPDSNTSLPHQLPPGNAAHSYRRAERLQLRRGQKPPFVPGNRGFGLRGGAGRAQQLASQQQEEVSVSELVKTWSRTHRTLFGPGLSYKAITDDNAKSFLEAALDLLGLTGRSKFAFHVDTYLNDNSTWKFDRTSDVEERQFPKVYKEDITNMLFHAQKAWILVVQPARDLNRGETHPADLYAVEGTTAISSNPRATATPVASDNIQPSKTSITPGRPVRRINQHHHAGPQPTTSAFPSSVDDNYTLGYNLDICGYTGKIRLQSGQQAKNGFREAALRLIGRQDDLRIALEFAVDLPSGQYSTKGRTILFSHDNFDIQYEEVQRVLKEKDPPKGLFVRLPHQGQKTYDLQKMQPLPNQSDIITLHRKIVGTGTSGSSFADSYWKIPRGADLNDDLCINQMQDGFFAALRFLFPDSPNSFGNVDISGHKLGRGSFELTKDLWDHIILQAKDGHRAHSVTISYDGSAKGLSYARLIGSNRCTSVFKSTDYNELRENVVKKLGHMTTAPLPKHFRIWRTSTARRDNAAGGSRLVNTSEIAASTATEQLSHLFGGPGVTGFVAEFRPNWGIFTIEDAENKDASVQWPPELGYETLESFRRALRRLYKDPTLDEKSPILISEDRTGGGQERRFIIQAHTSEEQWRLYIFDWFCSRKLYVRRVEDIPYKLDKSHEWGSLVEGLQQAQAARLVDEELQKEKDEREIQKQQGAAGMSFFRETVPHETRFNKSRIVKERAGKAIPKKWEPWAADQRELDVLQRNSYVKDQGTVVPGRLPQEELKYSAPHFGPSVELQHRVSDALPTIYVTRMTPTDVRQLQEENQHLRNAVLDREFKCQLCDQTFETYKKEEIQQHKDDHMARERLDGECVWCSNDQWGFMTVEQKQLHLRRHIDEEDTRKINNFWRAHDCPACNQSFKDMVPDQIVAHCINKHAPGVIRFCDKCGIREPACSTALHTHHQRTCRDAPDELVGSKLPEFCNQCGKNTSTQTSNEEALHKRDCHPTDQHFCRKCGFDISYLNANQKSAHDALCRRPGGRKKTYCRKCGENLGIKDQVHLNFHTEKCYKQAESEYTPEIPGKLADLQKAKADHARREADVLSREDFVRQRLIAIKAKENSVHQHELVIKENWDKNATKETELKRKQEQLQEREANLTTAQKNRIPPLTGLDFCPFDGCPENLEKFTREQLFEHLEDHAEQVRSIRFGQLTKFRCPLNDAFGNVCGVELDTSQQADFGLHLVHALTPEEQLEAARLAASRVPCVGKREVRDVSKDLDSGNRAGKAFPSPVRHRFNAGNQSSSRTPHQQQHDRAGDHPPPLAGPGSSPTLQRQQATIPRTAGINYTAAGKTGPSGPLVEDDNRSPFSPPKPSQSLGKRKQWDEHMGWTPPRKKRLESLQKGVAETREKLNELMSTKADLEKKKRRTSKEASDLEFAKGAIPPLQRVIANNLESMNRLERGEDPDKPVTSTGTSSFTPNRTGRQHIDREKKEKAAQAKRNTEEQKLRDNLEQANEELEMMENDLRVLKDDAKENPGSKAQNVLHQRSTQVNQMRALVRESKRNLYVFLHGVEPAEGAEEGPDPEDNGPAATPKRSKKRPRHHDLLFHPQQESESSESVEEEAPKKKGRCTKQPAVSPATALKRKGSHAAFVPDPDDEEESPELEPARTRGGSHRAHTPATATAKKRKLAEEGAVVATTKPRKPAPVSASPTKKQKTTAAEPAKIRSLRSTSAASAAPSVGRTEVSQASPKKQAGRPKAAVQEEEAPALKARSPTKKTAAAAKKSPVKKK